MYGINHRRFNDLLSIAVIGLGLYLIIMPFWPQITYWWQQRYGTTVMYSSEPKQREQDGVVVKPPPKENRLVIPALKLDEEIHEGGGEWVLEQGAWHRPQSADPTSSSNMVISGHRFNYSAPAVFYHLDKVNVGDKISVWWKQKEYKFRVTEQKVVKPTAVEIEAPTESRQLTLYTCTPLWTAKERLVVIAKGV